MIKFDQTGQMMMRAARVGEAAKVSQDREIMDKVVENTATGEYAAWRPAGTATTLYSDTSTDPYSDSTLDNVITDVLADETDLNSAFTNAALFTDEVNENPIHWTPKILLVGSALAGTAERLLNSPSSLVATYNAGVKNPWFGKGVQLVVSPWVDNMKSALYWFIGDFKKQFVFTEVFPLQTFRAKPGSEDEFNRDVIYQVKARWMGGCGAISNRYVIKSTGAG